jgi:hypothetical protein
MLVWNTQFPILPNNGSEDLLALCEKWIVGSPHSRWNASEIPHAVEGEVRANRKPDHCIEVATILSSDGDYAGFRHSWQDEEARTWVTEICGFRMRNRFLVGVHLHCSAQRAGYRIPKPKKPYVVGQILENLGGDIDGEFSVSPAPRCLLESEIDVAMRLLNGQIDHTLPVVYASATYRNVPAFDVHFLAKQIAGMAHVVFEPSRRFSFVLADRVGRINPYEGAVSICWPSGSNRASRLFPPSFADPRDFSNAIYETVRDALATARPDPRLTWDFIRELVVRRRIEALRKQGKAGIDDYIRAFDEELRLTRNRLAGAEDEIARLKRELALRLREDAIYAQGLLARGSEQDLFPGEHKDILHRALKIASDHVQPDGRIKDVLNAFLQANAPSGETQKLEERIGDLKKCNNPGPKELKLLQDLGFLISEDGKHRKLVFRGDDRYTFAMAKTGSDWRGMKNWVSDVCKRLFK